MKGYMYILECADGSYYIGSTKYLKLRIEQHQNGEGANHTKKRLPVKLVYCEVFQRIDEAFYREKQIQGWNRKKKEALINGEYGKLIELARNYTEFQPTLASTGSATNYSTGSANSDSENDGKIINEHIEKKESEFDEKKSNEQAEIKASEPVEKKSK